MQFGCAMGSARVGICHATELALVSCQWKEIGYFQGIQVTIQTDFGNVQLRTNVFQLFFCAIKQK
jgi:hypothetical protein